MLEAGCFMEWEHISPWYRRLQGRDRVFPQCRFFPCLLSWLADNHLFWPHLHRVIIVCLCLYPGLFISVPMSNSLLIKVAVIGVKPTAVGRDPPFLVCSVWNVPCSMCGRAYGSQWSASVVFLSQSLSSTSDKSPTEPGAL